MSILSQNIPEIGKESKRIEELKHSLEDEKRKRERAERLFAEEHKVVLHLRSRMNEVRHETAKLLKELEVEEEHITNTLQKKLNRTRQEKAITEKEVCKLKEKLERMVRDREVTARKVEEEEEFISNTLTKKLNAIMIQKQVLERSISRDSSSTRSSSVDEQAKFEEAPVRRGSRSNSSKNVVYKFM